MRSKIITITLIFAATFSVLLLQIGSLRAESETPAIDTAFSDQRESVSAAIDWMVSEFQNDDGGYSSFGGGANQAPSSIARTLDVVVALAAAGYDPAAVFPGQESSPLLFLRTNSDELLSYAQGDGGQAGKVVLALAAAAVDPRDFSGQDYVTLLIGKLEPSGTFGAEDPFKQASAMLGLAAAYEPVPATAIDWLEGTQGVDGSWDDGFGTASNPDATAIAIMGLLAAGRTPADASIQSARDFLASVQQPAGWEYGPGFGPNANTTAVVVQALSALGEDWYSDAGPWVKDGQTPLQALLAFQGANGAFQSDFGQGPFDDLYATVQAIPAAVGKPFPLPARFEAVRFALSCLETLQDQNAGGWAPFAGASSDASGTSRAIQAIRAAGDDPQSARWTTDSGVNAVEALEALTPAYLSSGRGGRVGIVMQGVAAAGQPYDVHDFAGEDLPLLATGYLSPTGELDSTAFGIFSHAEAMLGFLTAYETPPQSAVDFLLSAQQDGDWGGADANGIALQVIGRLLKSAPSETLDVLHISQLADGGWGYGDTSNPSSTSEVVQGLGRVGIAPFGPEWSVVVDGRLVNAADVVMSQQGESGCWVSPYAPGDDPYYTTDAILLLTQRSREMSTVNLPVVLVGPR